jgi:hypothetical protein
MMHGLWVSLNTFTDAGHSASIGTFAQGLAQYSLIAEGILMPIRTSSQLLAQSTIKRASELNQISDFNAKLWTELAALQANLTDSTISRYDVHSYFTAVLDQPMWPFNNEITSYGNGSDYFWVYVLLIGITLTRH